MAAKHPKKRSRTGKVVTKQQRLFTITAIDTAAQVSAALSEIYGATARGEAEAEQVGLMLNGIGKKLTLEGLKIRAGLYRNGHVRGFFLPA